MPLFFKLFFQYFDIFGHFQKKITKSGKVIGCKELRSVHNWREFTIGECSELVRCQIAGNLTVFSRPNLVGMVTSYQVIYPHHHHHFISSNITQRQKCQLSLLGLAVQRAVREHVFLVCFLTWSLTVKVNISK